MRSFSLKISISFHCLHMEHTGISSDTDAWLLSTGLGHTIPKFVFPPSLSFRTYQYSIPNQHAMSQGAHPCCFIHLPKITLQLCMTSLLPSLQSSVKPHNSWADSPRDTCLVRRLVRWLGLLQEAAGAAVQSSGKQRMCPATPHRRVFLFPSLSFSLKNWSGTAGLCSLENNMTWIFTSSYFQSDMAAKAVKSLHQHGWNVILLHCKIKENTHLS